MSADHPKLTTSAAAPADSISFRVDDMSCGHCAATIKRAVEKAVPGARVEADPNSKQVTVAGSNDFARLKEIVADAGYTATL